MESLINAQNLVRDYMKWPQLQSVVTLDADLVKKVYTYLLTEQLKLRFTMSDPHQMMHLATSLVHAFKELLDHDAALIARFLDHYVRHGTAYFYRDKEVEFKFSLWAVDIKSAVENWKRGLSALTA